MTKHKLILDDVFEDVVYTLIAIHCSLEDYRLAYLLNKNLKTNLIKKKEDLDFDNLSASFSIFEWLDKDHQTTWNLVNNICRQESKSLDTTVSLFENGGTNLKTFNLIPEYKSVDYFLKINVEPQFLGERKLIDAIQKIPQIITAYTIEAAQLKSKQHLIFY